MYVFMHIYSSCLKQSWRIFYTHIQTLSFAQIQTLSFPKQRATFIQTWSVSERLCSRSKPKVLLKIQTQSIVKYKISTGWSLKHVPFYPIFIIFSMSLAHSAVSSGTTWGNSRHTRRWLKVLYSPQTCGCHVFCII